MPARRHTGRPALPAALACAVLLAGPAAAAARPADSAPDAPDPQHSAPPPASAPAADPRPRLVIAGFEPAPDGDERDAWIATALEELLTYRLRRVPALRTVPTVRAYQGRQELKGPGPAPPWPAVAGALGADLLCAGRCRGTAARAVVELELRRLGPGGAPAAAVALPEARLPEALDAATRWLLESAGLENLPEPVAARVFAAPSRSLNAIEYYARATLAARAEQLSEALRCARESIASDLHFRPAQALLAQLELRAGALPAAGARWRALAAAARRADDALDRAQAELGQCLVAQVERSFDAARTRAETALELLVAERDPYGQLATLNVLCDLHLTRPPPGPDTPAAERERLVAENLAQAAAWQARALELLEALGDRVGALPATSKLALICERLDRLDDALALHQRTLALAEELGAPRHAATAWLYIGQCHRRRERWSDALDALNRCLALAEEPARPGVRIILGGIYLDMQQPAEALAQFTAAEAQLAGGPDLAQRFTCLHQSALARWQLGRRDEAIATLQQAIDVAHALELPDERALRTLLESWRSESP